MKMTILGTGCAMVTECYNTCFVISDEDKNFLVDGGGGSGILVQLKKAGIAIRDIHDIFVTHKHIDHILGIVWLIRAACQDIAKGKYEGDLTIYSHAEVLEILSDMATKLLAKKQVAFIGKRIHFVEVNDGESRKVIGHDVTFFDIQSTKDKQFGFMLDMGDGDRLTCCGDEPYKEHEEQYVRGSKWLLHEAFCLYGQREEFKPYEKHHSTVKEACELAAAMDVPNLVLYHTEDKNILSRKKLYGEEGATYYSGNLFVPDDLEVINL